MIRETANLTVLRNARVVTPEDVLDDHLVIIRGNRILDVVPDTGPHDGETVDLLGRFLLPGFIDTQVNGGGGVLFNDDPSPQTIKTMARAHARFGTTGLLPTLISDRLETIEAGLAAVETAMSEGNGNVLGIHIEGPFINTEKRGVHGAEHVRQLTSELLAKLKPLSRGATLITVAPETLEAGMIASLAEKGFLVNAGHSNANHVEVLRALDEGLDGFTHLFNAMSPLSSREPGMVGTALDSDPSYCGVIADGAHVSDAALRIALRCKGPKKLMLVTDAMPPLGTDLDQFDLLGARVTVKNGVCRDERGALAGSSLDLAGALRHFIAVTGCDLPTASHLCSTTAAEFLGLSNERGSIAPGLRADFAILDRDLQPVATVLGGQTYWPGRDD
jgi:N-acetylglucosamine-6-phosphate deacetylase